MIDAVLRGAACAALSLLAASAMAGTPGFVKPPPQAFKLDALAPLVQDGAMPVAFRGKVSPAWTASSDASWLVLSEAAGTGTATLHYTVDASKQVSALNWNTQKAHIRLQAAGLADLVVAVSLERMLPDVDMVAPAVVPSGQAAHMHVFGRGLGQLAGGAVFAVDGASVGAVQAVSDSEAWVDLDAPVAGPHMFSIVHASGIVSLQAMLAAVDATTTPPTAFVADQGLKGSLVVDESRQAVFTVNLQNDAVVRYTRQGAQWSRKASRMGINGSLGLSPDARTLYAISGTNTLVAIDADTLETKGRYKLPASKGVRLSFPMGQLRLPFTNDGHLWLAGDTGWGGPTAFDLSELVFVKPIANSGLYQPVPFATRDGSRLYEIQWGISPAQPLSVYAIAGGRTTPLPEQSPDVELPVSFNDAGTLLLNAQQAFYDAQGQNRGRLAPGGYDFFPVLSPDGTRAYNVGIPNQFGCIDHIDVYDATQATSPASQLAPIGSIPVSSPGVSCTNNGSFTSTIAIDALGRTIYWVGNDGFSVVAIPQELRAGGESAAEAPLRQR
jgi:hypothetical protein